MRLRDKLTIALLFHKLTSDPVMLAKIKSRKFWVTLIGGTIVLAGNELGIDGAITTKLVALLASYLLAQGAVDAASATQSK